jgi:DNA-binding MarR family transcriptional regulator
MSSIMRESIDHVKQVGEGTASAEDVLEAIHAVMHLYRSEQYKVLRDGPHDVTHLESKVLGFFARRPGATQSDLAAHSGRDRGQLARLVKGLKDRGLLNGEPDPEDRRNLRLQLTADGRQVQQALQRQGRRAAAVAAEGLSADERRLLLALLDRVRANLERPA